MSAAWGALLVASPLLGGAVGAAIYWRFRRASGRWARGRLTRARAQELQTLMRLGRAFSSEFEPSDETYFRIVLAQMRFDYFDHLLAGRRREAEETRAAIRRGQSLTPHQRARAVAAAKQRMAAPWN